MIDDRITDIISLALKYPLITKVGVFGSYARREQKAGSDIDILFDYCPENDYVFDVLDYVDELMEEFGRIDLSADCISYRGVIESGDRKTRDSILNDVVWVYERDA